MSVDLVICETRMLGAPELQAFSRLGGWARFPPFVFIAAFGEEELHVQARPFDAVAVLEKPLDISNCRDLVNSFLHHLTGENVDVPTDATVEMRRIPPSIGK